MWSRVSNKVLWKMYVVVVVVAAVFCTMQELLHPLLQRRSDAVPCNLCDGSRHASENLDHVTPLNGARIPRRTRAKHPRGALDISQSCIPLHQGHEIRVTRLWSLIKDSLEAVCKWLIWDVIWTPSCRPARSTYPVEKKKGNNNKKQKKSSHCPVWQTLTFLNLLEAFAEVAVSLIFNHERSGPWTLSWSAQLCHIGTKQSAICPTR